MHGQQNIEIFCTSVYIHIVQTGYKLQVCLTTTPRTYCTYISKVQTSICDQATGFFTEIPNSFVSVFGRKSRKAVRNILRPPLSYNVNTRYVNISLQCG